MSRQAALMARRGSKKTGEGQYAPFPYAMLKSPAWRHLSGAAVRVLMELHTRFNGSNNGALHLSYAEAAKTLGMGKATVQRAFQDLQAKGFLVRTQEGDWYHRKAHEWRLTFKPVQAVKGRVPPSNDWRSWAPEKTKRGSETDHEGASVVSFQNRSSMPGSNLELVSNVSRPAMGSGTEH